MTDYSTTVRMSRDEALSMIGENDEQVLYILFGIVDNMDPVRLLDEGYDDFGVDDINEVADTMRAIANRISTVSS